MTEALVHLGYALMLCALVARDILWLRGLLVAAQSLLAIYAWNAGVPSIAWWNVAFVIINTVWVARILDERRAITLPADLAPLHREQFAALTPPEFLRFWNDGRKVRLPAGTRLTTGAAFPDALHFLLSGHVRITRGATEITTLTAGFFVGEMSLLTGSPANADAVTLDEVVARRWDVDYLRAMRVREPGLWTRIQSVLGRDIVAKIQRSAL